ncbi:PIN domain-like protein [Panus rudis PR-1116 ss-1]|nr:PIN domain-like protein [Panus rudis PR-1116 ss-1]
MGIHGLTTYLRENRSTVVQYLRFTSGDHAATSQTPLVIDGWSFIYEIFALSNLPWVYGGEYDEFSKVVRSVVRSWLDVGLHLYFVFDGVCPYPEPKFPTVTSRVTKNTIQGSLLFFRTSSVSRSKPRFLSEIGIIPPRAYAACVESLQRIIREENLGFRLEIHYADEEGDPYAVELAARLGGYVVGKDSDFVILNAEGYKGYIPMDEMVWTSLSSETTPSHAANDDDDGFQTVVKPKTKKKAAQDSVTLGNGMIPPPDVTDLQLTVAVYSPSAVASHLQIPPSLLPLLGALVGNDFTADRDQSSATTSQERNLHWLFFERQLTPSQRILRVANTIRDILTTALSSKGKQKQQVHSVMQLIERAVNALLIRSPDSMTSGEREKVIDRIVEATLQYAIPRYEGSVAGADGLWSSPLCALHEVEGCALLHYLIPPTDLDIPENASQEQEQKDIRDEICRLYVNAYRTGKFDPRLLDIMKSGTFWYRHFLENPDMETVSKSIGRPILELCYSILEDGLGLPQLLDEEEDANEADNAEDDEDELIDVVEESDNEDPLAPLRGVLHELATPADSDDEMTTEPSPSDSTRAKRASKSTRPKTIEEHLRRGTRLAAEEVLVPSLSEVLTHFDVAHLSAAPLLLASEEDRLTFILRALQSDVSSVRALESKDILIVLALRWVVARMYARAEASNGNKDRLKERWTKQEARAFLGSFFTDQSSIDPAFTPPIEDRHIQLVAQTSAAFEAIERLVQLLLLTDRFETPVLRFSGKVFHGYLTGTLPLPPSIIPDMVWDAAMEDIEHAYIEPLGKKKKASRGEQPNGVAGTPATKKQKGKIATVGGLYSILGDAEA